MEAKWTHMHREKQFKKLWKTRKAQKGVEAGKSVKKLQKTFKTKRTFLATEKGPSIYYVTPKGGRG